MSEPDRHTFRGLRQFLLTGMVMLACALPGLAFAEVKIEGTRDAIRVSTSNDTIGDVLSALGATFNMRHRSDIPLDTAAEPAYAGSVAQVISRLLDGYSYVIKRNAETQEIVVFGSRGETAIPAPAPAPARSAPRSPQGRRLPLAMTGAYSLV